MRIVTGNRKERLQSQHKEETIPATGHKDENNDGKCDICLASLRTEQPTAPDNVFLFLKSFLNNLIDFLRKLFGIK